jgi:4-hydroxybenzoate polyprenyltransferase
MSSLVRIYRVLNILSIDVVIGAVTSALFFASIFDVAIRPFGIIALALTVWIIYTLDHLRDGLEIRQRASSLRHAFHQQHRKSLCIFLLAAAAIDFVMLFHVRTNVLVGGIGLSLLVGIYLVIQRRFHFLKEVLVAIMYLLGVLLPSIAVTTLEFSVFHFTLIIQFFFISFLNLMVFSLYTVSQDEKDGLGSFVVRFGEKKTNRLIVYLFFAEIVLAVAGTLISQFHPASFVPLIMSLVMFLIFRFPQFFRRGDYYRFAGDAIFFIPAMYLIWIS